MMFRCFWLRGVPRPHARPFFSSSSSTSSSFFNAKAQTCQKALSVGGNGREVLRFLRSGDSSAALNAFRARPDAVGATSLISAIRDVRTTLEILETLPLSNADVLVFNAALKVVSEQTERTQSGTVTGTLAISPEEAHAIWCKMFEVNIIPEESTFILYTTICRKQGNSSGLHQALHMFCTRVAPTPKIIRAWASACCALNDISQSPSILKELHVRFVRAPDRVALGMLIGACVRFKDGVTAVGLLKEIRAGGWQVDPTACGQLMQCLPSMTSVFSVLELMQEQHLPISEQICAIMLTRARQEPSAGATEKIQQIARDHGLLRSRIVLTGLISAYSACLQFESAAKLFAEARGTFGDSGIDLPLWSTCIQALGAQGKGADAVQLFDSMVQAGVRPDVVSALSVLHACAQCAMLDVALSLFERFHREYNLARDVRLCSSIIPSLCKAGRIDDAIWVAGQCEPQDAGAWLGVLAGAGGLLSTSHLDTILKHLHEPSLSLSIGDQSAATAITSIFQALALSNMQAPSVSALSWPLWQLGEAVKTNCVEVAKAGCSEIDVLLSSSPRICVDPLYALAVLYSLSKLGLLREAMSLFDRLVVANLSPHSSALWWITQACSEGQNVGIASELLSRAGSAQLKLDSSAYGHLIRAFLASNRLAEAVEVLDVMTRTRTVLTSHHYSMLFSAAGALAQLGLGVKAEEHLCRHSRQLLSDSFIQSSLISMHAKCGEQEKAISIFESARRTDTPSREVWNALLAALAAHGKGADAVRFFNDMISCGISPSAATLVSIFTGMSHRGQVDDALSFFGRVSADFSDIVTSSVVVCVVDCLARSGRLSDAEQLMRDRACNEVVGWMCILSACRGLNQDVGCAERSFLEVLRLCSDSSRPELAAAYVLMCNLYSLTDRREEAARLRSEMQSKRISKIPGRTWIEIDGRTTIFAARDESHPLWPQMQAENAKLSVDLAAAGYVAFTGHVTQDVSEEEKLALVSVHSEKLAILYGLVVTAPGTPLRILQNLRVCLDCHTVIKLISKVRQRAIVMRDSSRFHHFSNGECSCGDFY